MAARYKLGRGPALRPAALADLGVYARGKLPRPPASVRAPQIARPLDGNADYGDCVMAGVAHMIEASNAENSERLWVPDEAQVVKRYLTLSPGDTGLVEANVLSLWHREGNFHCKIAGYAPIDPRDILALHQSIAFYGPTMLGILCPESAQRQFAEQEQSGEEVPWTYEGEEAEAGHCIVASGYNAQGLECETWGGLALVTYQFLAHYLEEAWCVLMPQVVARKRDSVGIDLRTLQADLARV